MSITTIIWCVIGYLYFGFLTLAGSEDLAYDFSGKVKLMVFIFWPIAWILQIYKLVANAFRKRKDNDDEKN